MHTYIGVGIGSGRFGFGPKVQNRPDRRLWSSDPFRTGFFGLRVVRFARVRFGLDGLGYLWPIKFCLNFIFFQHLFYWFGLSFFFNSFFYWFGPLAHFSFLWNFVIFTCSKIQIIPLHHIFYILLILKKKIKTFLDFLY
jgi:hypothetical protein